MKKIIFIALCTLSMTLFSFRSATGGSVELTEGGMYLSDCTNFSDADEASLDDLQQQMAVGFFVRCEKKCCCKFSKATIAGSGCASIECDNTAEVAAIRRQVDAIMANYMR
jgi:hypothetical protein